MRNIWILAKNYFLCTLGGFRGKKKRASKISGVAVTIILFIAFFALMQFMAIGKIKYAVTPYNVVLFLDVFVAFIFVFILSLQKVTGGQKSNDIELLGAMPLKRYEIIIGKSISRFLSNFIVVFIFVMPIVIAYMIYVSSNIVTLFAFILLMLCISFITEGICYIFDFIGTMLFSKFKINPVINSIFIIIVIIGFMVLYQVVLYMPKFWDFGIFLMDNVISFNFIFMISIIIISLGTYILGATIFSFTLGKSTNTGKAKIIKLNQKNNNGILATLLKKESNKFMNSTALLINNLIGPLGILAVTVWLIVDPSGLNSFMLLPGFSPVLILSLIFMFLAAMTFASSSSISLEGLNFWILKTLPIKTSNILLSKSLFNVILFSPLSIVCSIIIGNVLSFNASDFALIILLPVAVNVLVSFMGVFINVLYPKFDFESEYTLIKQSLPSFIMALNSMLILGLMILLISFFPANITLILWLSFGVIALLATIFIILLFTVGKRIFNKL